MYTCSETVYMYTCIHVVKLYTCIHVYMYTNMYTSVPYEKNEPTLDHSGGGGVHDKACWLIAYLYFATFLVGNIIFSAIFCAGPP